MSPPFFSLIVVNYQSAKLLERFLQSWAEPLRTISYEIIIVNNDTRETEVLRELALVHPSVTVQELGENRGFARASNAGAVIARGTYLCFLNPDTEYIDGSLPALETVLAMYPRSLGGVRLIDGRGNNEAWSAGPFPTLWRLMWQNCFGPPRQPVWEATDFALTDWVSGAALIMPRVIFEELGGFDDHFFLYFEDVDLARRARSRGILTWRSPLLTIQHKGGGSHTGAALQKQAYYESQRRYFAKHRGQLETTLLTLAQRLFLRR